MVRILGYVAGVTFVVIAAVYLVQGATVRATLLLLAGILLIGQLRSSASAGLKPYYAQY